MAVKKNVAVIIPLLNESENISLFYTTLNKLKFNLSKYTLRLIFVDDGSNDNSWEKLTQISHKDRSVSAIKLAKNFGSHTAWFAGLESTVNSAHFFVLTTIDLQNPPELIPKMLERLQKNIRIVCAVRQSRLDSILTKWFSRTYYKLVRMFALPNMPDGGMDCCAFDKKVALDLVNMAEKNTSLLGLILWLGYPKTDIYYTRKKRIHGVSHWTYVKKIKLFVDTFVAFSFVPIRLVSYLGFMFSLLGFTYAVIIFIRRIIYGAPIEGWSSLMLVVLFLSGVQLITLGIVAEYVWRTLDANRKRPLYIIDKKLNI